MPLTLTLLLGLVAGCSSSDDKAIQRNEQATTGLQQTRNELDAADAQVDATLNSLRALASQDSGDLRPTYKKFSDDVDKLGTMADDARNRATAMRERSTEYINKWRQEAEGISDPQLRQASEQRQASARADFEKVAALAQQTRAAYDPFMKDLRDIRTALSNDLTPAGVRAVRPVIDRTIQEGQAVRGRIGALNAEIDALSRRWSSAMRG